MSFKPYKLIVISAETEAPHQDFIGITHNTFFFLFFVFVKLSFPSVFELIVHICNEALMSRCSTDCGPRSAVCCVCVINADVLSAASCALMQFHSLIRFEDSIAGENEQLVLLHCCLMSSNLFVAAFPPSLLIRLLETCRHSCTMLPECAYDIIAFPWKLLPSSWLLAHISSVKLQSICPSCCYTVRCWHLNKQCTCMYAGRKHKVLTYLMASLILSQFHLLWF